MHRASTRLDRPRLNARRPAAIAALLLAAGTAASASTSDFTPTHHIHGSWVNLRASPSATAQVIRQLVVNTPVRLLAEHPANGFCKVSTTERQEGFVQCKLVGDKPLTAENLGAPTLEDGRPNPAYSAPRAFWISPSVPALLAAGAHFEAAMLSEERRAKDKALMEASPGKAVVRRFAVPEFEAMKDRLKQGLVAGDPSLQQHFTPWAELQKSPSMLGHEAAAEAIRLPEVKASFFTHDKALLGPAISPEAASHAFGIPYRALTRPGPKWIPPGHYNDGMQFGAWDVGDVETELLHPIHEHTLHTDRTLTSRPTRAKGGLSAAPDADGGDCNIGFGFGDADAKLMEGFGTATAGKKAAQRLFSFYTAAPLPGPARVVVTRVKLPAAGKPTKEMQEGGQAAFVAATSHHVDIDNDGIFDLVAWEGTTRMQEDLHRPAGDFADYRAFFVNIGGTWRLMATDQFVWGCGC